MTEQEKEEKGCKISLAGDLGSGKSTVSALLVEQLGAIGYSTGDRVREIAKARGMSVCELNAYMETHPEIDREIDDGLVRLSDDPRPMIIDSRLAWHFTRGTFKVYMSVDPQISASRILKAGRATERFCSAEEAVAGIRERRKSETMRYRTQYGIDITDFFNYDLILDASYATPEEVAFALREAFRIWKEDRDFRAVMVSPKRLLYPDDPPDAEQIAAYMDKLAAGEDVPPVEVFEHEGDLYLASGLESALASAMMSARFIQATLVKASPAGKTYVRMADSL